MADITTDITPTDIRSADVPRQPSKRQQRGVEYYVYFSLIFIIAIPVGCERYIANIVRKRSLDVRGPLARAWAEADRITPFIFTVR